MPIALTLTAVLTGRADLAHAQAADPRLREVTYDARTVVTVPVKRGVVTHVLLDADEVITDVATGLGSDCAKPETAWCIAAQAGGRSLFVKPKSSAHDPNNVAVVTDRRTHAFAFVVLADGDIKAPVFRLTVKAPLLLRPLATARPGATEIALPLLPIAVPEPDPSALVDERLRAGPMVVNSSYSIAEGDTSDDIVPTLVFDDGRFTYLRFPGNREVPAVFHVLGDGSETLVNTRMEGELLVVDRVRRRLMLRAGSAVVAVWNDAFDLDGSVPIGAVTVPGVQRVVKAEATVPGRPAAHQGDAR